MIIKATNPQPKTSIHLRNVFYIALPPHLISPATRKNLSPRPIADAIKNGRNAICKKPALTVNSL